MSNSEDTNFEGARAFVQMKRQHGQESLSGPGSWLENAGDTIQFTQNVIRKYQVRSILDLGCGDWNWFRKIDLGSASYLGWDADEKMIESNQQAYGSGQVCFDVRDIVTEPYPDVDLVICRDVLFHMTVPMAQKVISKVSRSARYLLATSFPDIPENSEPQRYTNFDKWGYYSINLDIPPFALGSQLVERVMEKKLRDGEYQRHVCLYEFREFPE